MSSYFANIVEQLTSTKVRKFANELAKPFAQVPHLPKGIVEFLVMIAPWLVGLAGVVGAVSGLSLVLNAAGLYSSMWMQFAGFSRAYFLVIGVLELASAGLLLLAFTPLKERKMAGWLLLLWNLGLSIAQNTVSVLAGYGMISMGSLLWVALSAVVIAYFLFEMRSQYSK